MESRLLLNVVVCKRPAVLELLSCKDQALLVRRDTLLVLDLLLDVLDVVRALDLKGDGLPSKCLDKDLHGGGGVIRARVESNDPLASVCIQFEQVIPPLPMDQSETGDFLHRNNWIKTGSKWNKSVSTPPLFPKKEGVGGGEVCFFPGWRNRYKNEEGDRAIGVVD